ncbi:hypothetical protein [Gordonia sp. OPL2]|uniref:hypothetical protein n=1 Tax=Gordonia sp. OPL2 TaxID=2486274 RepID=UPI001656304E|nr:hypothetical protein [Gordonia sp. OPL2]
MRDAIAGAVTELGVHSPASTVDRSVGEKTRVVVAGIYGPDHELFGAKAWVGPTGTEPGAPPRASGFIWETDTRLIHLAGVGDILVPELETGRSTITAPEFFRVFEPEDSLSLIRFLIGGIDADDGYHCVARYLETEESVAAVHLVLSDKVGDLGRKGIAHDVAPPGGSWPTLESAALSALPTLSPADTHIVLVDIAKVRLIRWLTDPIREVQWKGMVDNRDTPHPADVERIFATVAPVLEGSIKRAEVNGVRLRRIGGGWTVVDADGVLVDDPALEGPKLGLIRFRVVGFSDEPDPVPADDQGHPGLSEDAAPSV